MKWPSLQMALASMVCLLTLLGACSSGELRPMDHPQPPTAALDSADDALVAKAQTKHAQVDQALTKGQRQEAKQTLGSLITQATQEARASQGRDVIYDAATRLARLHLEDGELEAAEASAREALPKTPPPHPSLFQGHLHQVLAEVLEAKGDAKGAVQEHAHAIDIFRAILDRDAAAQPPKEAP